MSSAEYEIRRLEANIASQNKKLEENTREAKRSEERGRWELSRLTREYQVRERGFTQKAEVLTKELEQLLVMKDRAQHQMDEEAAEEEAEKKADDLAHGRNFNHRIH